MIPMIVIRMEMTIATIGRLMKKEAMLAYFSSGLGWSPAGGGVHGLASTGMPPRTFVAPSTMTVSPAFKPDSMTQSLPSRCPTFTGRISALPSVTKAI
jgi:hypothetical protein